MNTKCLFRRKYLTITFLLLIVATYGLHHGFQYNYLYKMRFKYGIHNKYFIFHLNTLYYVTNHVMHADDICLIAPSAIALLKMLNLCYEFSQSNNIIFNPIKSQCMVFKPNRFTMYCPAVYLNGNFIDYVDKNKIFRIYVY